MGASRRGRLNRTLIETLAGELPEWSAEVSFGRACVVYSTGSSERAVPLYRDALARGLGPARRVTRADGARTAPPRYRRSVAAYACELVDDEP